MLAKMHYYLQFPSLLVPLLSFIKLGEAALYSTVIQTSYGSIQGYPAFNSSPTGNLSQWQDITVWKGIPFAASTGGQNRFRPPQTADSWNDTLDAKDFGPICPVAVGFPTNYTVDEDCLSLNIWSPANSSDANLPVVMWSYPAESTAADPLFDGGGMADKNIVFVNYNYRTGSFGWLAHPWLSAENEQEIGRNISGNWGMLDQFAALKWIKANIASFGGDPEHITVMGQSAGSAATYHIVNSPLTEGLIVGAIIESGVRDPHDPLCASLAEGYSTLEANLETGIAFVDSLNITSLDELRSVNMSELVTTFMGSKYRFGATLDGYAMPSTYLESLQKGPANNVPIITGNTKDESGANYGQAVNISTYYSDLNATFDTSTGNWTSEFLALYPPDNATSAEGAYNSQWTDRSKVGTWLWSTLWYTGASSPVYTYFWDHAPPNQTRGAYHESEINYVLNNLYATRNTPWTAEDYEIAAKMNGYWSNFIKTGNPNGGDLVQWDAAGADAVVQHVGNGWGSIPVAPANKTALFEAWFDTQPAF